MLTWRMVVIVASVNATPNAKMRTAKTNRRPICASVLDPPTGITRCWSAGFNGQLAGHPPAKEAASHSLFKKRMPTSGGSLLAVASRAPAFIPGFLFEVRDASLSLGEERA
jgi:hypothetical protein